MERFLTIPRFQPIALKIKQYFFKTQLKSEPQLNCLSPVIKTKILSIFKKILFGCITIIPSVSYYYQFIKHLIMLATTSTSLSYLTVLCLLLSVGCQRKYSDHEEMIRILKMVDKKTAKPANPFS